MSQLRPQKVGNVALFGGSVMKVGCVVRSHLDLVLQWPVEHGSDILAWAKEEIYR